MTRSTNIPGSSSEDFWSYFGRRLAEHAEIRKGSRVLDIGFGKGTSLLPAAEIVGPEGQVVGIDIYDQKIKNVSLEIKRRGLKNTTIINMNAKNMDFDDNSFDFILSGFSYVFYSLADAYRLLKRGGRIAVSSWALAGDLEWMGEAVQSLCPEGLYVGHKDIDEIGEDGCPRVYGRDTTESLTAVLHKARFQEVKVISEEKRFSYDSEEACWNVISSSGWQDCMKRIDETGPGGLAAFRQETFRILQKYKAGNCYRYTRSVLLGFGTK